MKRNEINVMSRFEEIFVSEDPAIDQLARGFHFILGLQLSDSRKEIDLLKAMGDREGLIKEQIKNSTIEHVITRFDDCYFRATGKKWDRKKRQDG